MGLAMERRGLERGGIPLEEQGMRLEARGMRLAERFLGSKRSLTTESKENPAGLTGLLRLSAESPVFFLPLSLSPVRGTGYFAGSNFIATPFMQ
jgi:hypothetical protein